MATTIPIPVPCQSMQNSFIDYNMAEEEEHAYAVSKAHDSAMFNRIVNGISRGMHRHNEKTFWHGHSMEDIVYQEIASRSLDNIYRNHFEGRLSPHGDLSSGSGLTKQVDSCQSDDNDTCDSHVDLPLRRNITTSNFAPLFSESERSSPSSCEQTAFSYHQNQNDAALCDCDGIFCLDL
jgi:hypothetical protein